MCLLEDVVKGGKEGFCWCYFDLGVLRRGVVMGRLWWWWICCEVLSGRCYFWIVFIRNCDGGECCVVEVWGKGWFSM